jgi:hypothetical protein
MTKTSHRWQTKPGNFDRLRVTEPFPTDNRWGIPALQPTPLSQIPAWLIPYGQKATSKQSFDDGALHFFLEDYRFETVWNRPRQTLPGLRRYRTLLTPDFSLYRDWPLAAQLWNVYRNRWCGRFWQSQGFRVIPTVSWSGAASYDYAFLGVPRRGVVAVGAVGAALRETLAYDLFVDGFAEMVRRLEPAVVLSYGRLPAVCHELAEVVAYPTRWSGVRAARRQAREADDGLRLAQASRAKGLEKQ